MIPEYCCIWTTAESNKIWTFLKASNLASICSLVVPSSLLSSSSDNPVTFSKGGGGGTVGEHLYWWDFQFLNSKRNARHQNLSLPSGINGIGGKLKGYVGCWEGLLGFGALGNPNPGIANCCCWFPPCWVAGGVVACDGPEAGEAPPAAGCCPFWPSALAAGCWFGAIIDRNFKNWQSLTDEQFRTLCNVLLLSPSGPT